MKPSTLSDYKRRMLRVLMHIQRNLDEDLPLTELARVACFSPHHFHRIFKGMMKETLQGHVRRLRLERAAGQLKTTRTPVTRLAMDAGYDAPEAFTRAFKLAFGVSPVGFRRRRNTLYAREAASGVHYEMNGEPRVFRAVRSTRKASEATIKHFTRHRVAFLRHTGPYSEVGPTWDLLLTALGKEGFISGDTLFLGICHDDPDIAPHAHIRYDACVTVGKHFEPIGDIGIQWMEGGECAVMTHFGPYDKLGESYARLFGEWLPRSGREPGAAPCFESYLNSPEDTDPEELITDIHLPLRSPTHSMP